jgi:hypothetical protein
MDQKNQGHSSGQQQDESRQQDQRDPAEGARDTVRNDQAGNEQATPRDRNRSDGSFSGNQSRSERGKGSQGERNRAGGISNRGMDRESEQQDLPSRGSNRSSER